MAAKLLEATAADGERSADRAATRVVDEAGADAGGGAARVEVNADGAQAMQAVQAVSAPPRGAASALLLFVASRSDVAAARAMCALGVCERALTERPSPAALFEALAAATPLTLARRVAARLAGDESAAALSDGGGPQEEEERGGAGGGLRRDRSSLGRMVSRAYVARRAMRSLELHWGASGRPLDAEASLGGVTALHIAAFGLHEDMVETMLLSAPRAASLTDHDGRTALHYVAHGTERVRASPWPRSQHTLSP